MTILEQAELFVWRNGRLLERARFAFHFLDGSGEAVRRALLAYQNEDGGFGNGLEPDIRCPDSQPVPAQHALEFLDEVGFDAEIAGRVCDYLATITTAEGGVPWLMPSAHQYPRAPWWQAEAGLPASLNPTAAIVGLLHKNNFHHPWLVGATAFCWSAIEALDPTEFHTAGTALTFLFHAPDQTRAAKEMDRLFQQMRTNQLVADVDAEGYVRKPLDWAPTPDHPLRSCFSSEAIEASLDGVMAEQKEDGGWDIPWPPLSAGCHLEWRGWVTVEKLRLLKGNGRLS